MAINDPDNIPSSVEPAASRRAGCWIAIVLTVVVVGTVGYGLWDGISRSSVAGGSCGSDGLSISAIYLRKYAEQHEGRLPPADELLTVAAGEHQLALGCGRMRLPFQWDLRLAGKKLDQIEGRAIVWCPPGGHRNYVGAIVVEKGTPHSKTLTISELKTRVGNYWEK